MESYSQNKLYVLMRLNDFLSHSIALARFTIACIQLAYSLHYGDQSFTFKLAKNAEQCIPELANHSAITFCSTGLGKPLSQIAIRWMGTPTYLIVPDVRPGIPYSLDLEQRERHTRRQNSSESPNEAHQQNII